MVGFERWVMVLHRLSRQHFLNPVPVSQSLHPVGSIRGSGGKHDWRQGIVVPLLLRNGNAACCDRKKRGCPIAKTPTALSALLSWNASL